MKKINPELQFLLVGNGYEKQMILNKSKQVETIINIPITKTGVQL